MLRYCDVTVQTVTSHTDCLETCSCFFPEGGDGQLDPVCKEAVNAVENAY